MASKVVSAVTHHIILILTFWNVIGWVKTGVVPPPPQYHLTSVICAVRRYTSCNGYPKMFSITNCSCFGTGQSLAFSELNNDSYINLVTLLYQKLLSLVLEGARKALRECKRQFKDNIWNCSISDEQNPKGVPLFLNTKLPFGKIASWLSYQDFVVTILSTISSHRMFLSFFEGLSFCLKVLLTYVINSFFFNLSRLKKSFRSYRIWIVMSLWTSKAHTHIISLY